VTEQRRTEEAYRAVVENSLQALVILQTGAIGFANQATADLLGYTVDELLAMTPETISASIHPDDHAMVWQRFRDRMEGKEVPPRYEFRMLRRDGSVVWVEMCAARITYRGELAIQAALVDITSRKRRELEQQAVLAAVTALRATGNLGEMLAQILAHVSELLDAEGALVALREASSGDAVLELARGKWASLTGDRIAAGEGATSRVMEGREAYLSHDVAADARFVRRDVLATTRVVLGVPLFAADEPVGALWVGRNADMDEDDVRLLTTFAEMIAVAVRRATLLDEVQRSRDDLEQAYDSTLEGWSRALDLRDRETQGHTQRVARMAIRLARLLGLDEESLIHLRRGALLHDIGKMGIPDCILLKPGPLTDDEWQVMRAHTTLGRDMLAAIDYLQPVLDIPLCHHEWWDGSGYPLGLEGEEIPLAARVFAVVDVWDALRSDRPYRAAWSAERALELIRSQSGTHFDPRVVEAFLRLVPELMRT
jgi:PAS domain S-box-containing protein/putative nucleotidyltransferase with HDIG domain